MPGKAPPPPPLLARALLGAVRTRAGMVLFSLLALLLSTAGAVWRLVRHPLRVLRASPPRDHLQELLHAPSMGLHLFVPSSTPGINLHLVSKGERGAPLVLFLHGFPEFWYSWRHQMAGIPEGGRYHCVAMDMRGYGDSDKSSRVEDFDLLRLSSDVKEVIEQLGAGKALAVVGHDWGAMVAYAFAARFPEMLDRLVILNGPHPAVFSRQIFTYPQILKSIYIFAFQAPYLPELLVLMEDCRDVQAAIFGRRGGIRNRAGVSREEQELYKFAFSRPGVATSAINYYRSMARSPGTWLPKITTPTLLLWGKDDAYLGTEVNIGLEEHVPNLEYKEIDNCSHWAQVDQPELVNREILRFISQAGKKN